MLSVAGRKRPRCESVPSESPSCPSLPCFDSPGPADHSLPFLLSLAGGQADSLSKRDFSLLSWKTLLLASWGFQLLGVGL